MIGFPRLSVSPSLLGADILSARYKKPVYIKKDLISTFGTNGCNCFWEYLFVHRYIINTYFVVLYKGQYSQVSNACDIENMEKGRAILRGSPKEVTLVLFSG